MLLYCFITYSICVGMLMDERDSLEEWSNTDIFLFVLSPIIIPVIVGMSLNNRNNDK